MLGTRVAAVCGIVCVSVLPPARPAAAVPVEVSAAAEFVETCGTQLCLGSRTFPFYGASSLTAVSDPGGAVSQARSTSLNVLRLVNFLQERGDPSKAPYDEARWVGVDRAIAVAAGAGLKVELDLSTYRNLLLNSGINAYTADWGPFVRFVTQRRNTVTGDRYAADPTIALVAFAGEVEPPGSAANRVGYTSREITAFYARTLQQWRANDPRHLLTPGGLLHLDYASGIDWRAIVRLKVVDVPAIHIYSGRDRTVTQPAFASFSRSLGKPWLTEEFGLERAAGDATRAAWFAQIHLDQLRYSSAGSAFWNLGPQQVSPTFDVNRYTPMTWQTIRRDAPAPLRRWLWWVASQLRAIQRI